MPCNPCNHPHVAVLANGRGKLGIAGQNGLGHGRGGVLRYKMSRLGQQQAVMFRKGGLETLAFVRSDERVAPAPAQQYPAIATLCEILLDTREEFGAVEQLTREPMHGGPALALAERRSVAVQHRLRQGPATDGDAQPQFQEGVTTAACELSREAAGKHGKETQPPRARAAQRPGEGIGQHQAAQGLRTSSCRGQPDRSTPVMGDQHIVIEPERVQQRRDALGMRSGPQRPKPGRSGAMQRQRVRSRRISWR